MFKFYVPDSVADEVHEREIDPKRIEGLPLILQVLIINLIDNYEIVGAETFAQYSPPGMAASDGGEYSEKGGVGVLQVNTDRDHWYGIVFSPTDPEAARKKAKEVLRTWNPLEEGDDE